VKGRFGLQIRPDLLLKDVLPGDFAALAIPGGFFSAGYGEAFDPLLYEIARSIHGAGGTIATMCVGILPVLLESMIGPEACREVRRFMAGME
jgi:4-methyl-5(b-hydroxyethyl)-thiazole monophosphate biosynthesis